ncbi:hypothetical protein [Yoonia litorea]|uniref:Uncharacterized protein n=1 Tax=Yoonia litorea TaxID=1123755 RepID=A0A1I6N2U1_9RHOB|nr:hypothetical protein [Yoonia litorea]SFS22256.1 hypothetical protein SAMN05444714_3224 [Yoonia litorea]
MNKEAHKVLSLTIWEQATRLSRAPLLFTPKELKEAYDEADKISAIETFSDGAERIGQDGTPPTEGFKKLLMNVSSITSEKAKARENLRTYVRQRLRQGELIGYGFEPPRRMDSQPFEIPRNCWHGRIDWVAATLNGEGLEFIEVRLIASLKREQLIATLSQLDLQQAKTVGRPKIGPHIEAAFKSLHQANKIDVSASAKSHFPMVQLQLRKMYPDIYPPERMLSNEGIRAHFSPLFNELKEQQ